MEPLLAAHLSEASRAAYPDSRDCFELWTPVERETFAGDRFSGFVASNKNRVVVSFRGTDIRLDTQNNLTRSVLQLLTHVTYAQDRVPGRQYRVHRGYYRELNSVYDKVASLIKAQRSKHTSLYITGHSAGGAVATLAGQRLAEDGVDVNGVYTFSSPRVGDKIFREQYRVPLFRFELGNDLVPHFPLPPSLSKLIGGFSLDKFFDGLDSLCSRFNINLDSASFAPGNIEYVHAGQLYYGNSIKTHSLIYTVNSKEFVDYYAGPMKDLLRNASRTVQAKGRMRNDDRAVLVNHHPGLTPVEKSFMDGVRMIEIFKQIREQLKGKQVDFINDHALDNTRIVINRLRAPKSTFT